METIGFKGEGWTMVAEMTAGQEVFISKTFTTLEEAYQFWLSTKPMLVSYFRREAKEDLSQNARFEAEFIEAGMRVVLCMAADALFQDGRMKIQLDPRGYRLNYATSGEELPLSRLVILVAARYTKLESGGSKYRDKIQEVLADVQRVYPAKYTDDQWIDVAHRMSDEIIRPAIRGLAGKFPEWQRMVDLVG